MARATDFSFDVFLSHNAKDKPQVRRLAKRLRAAGLRVWFDEWIIQPGDDIYLAIERGLEHSRTMILCLSPHALGSDWVGLERSTVLFRDPSNKGRRFIPLLLADCDLSDTLRRYKYLDFREEAEGAFEELVGVCRFKTEAAQSALRPEPAQGLDASAYKASLQATTAVNNANCMQEAINTDKQDVGAQAEDLEQRSRNIQPWRDDIERHVQNLPNILIRYEDLCVVNVQKSFEAVIKELRETLPGQLDAYVFKATQGAWEAMTAAFRGKSLVKEASYFCQTSIVNRFKAWGEDANSPHNAFAATSDMLDEMIKEIKENLDEIDALFQKIDPAVTGMQLETPHEVGQVKSIWEQVAASTAAVASLSSVEAFTAPAMALSIVGLIAAEVMMAVVGPLVVLFSLLVGIVGGGSAIEYIAKKKTLEAVDAILVKMPTVNSKMIENKVRGGCDILANGDERYYGFALIRKAILSKTDSAVRLKFEKLDAFINARIKPAVVCSSD